ncbi:MAG TPA: hypothetical protein VFH25_05540 [Nitrososphaeraceae archaeon]|nr:hypothetical protein [Nitrososphaeraceae archaeon]
MDDLISKEQHCGEYKSLYKNKKVVVVESEQSFDRKTNKGI